MQPADNPPARSLALPAAVDRLAGYVRTARLAGRDADFAADLIRNFQRKGLSARQAEWVYRLCERVDAPRPPVGNVGDLSRLLALFARAAAAGLKHPKVRLVTATGARLVLAVCGARSKTPGDLRATDGGPFEGGRYYGRVALDGGWHPGRDATPDVLGLLTAMAQDPAATATAYGRRTGACCFCGRDLEDGRSVAVGYGPVCADKFGLPWGEVSTPAIDVNGDAPAVIDPTAPGFAE